MTEKVYLWPHFTKDELACRHCGEHPMDPAFMERLERLRADFGPMPVSSGYRCPVHNARVSSTGATGPHTTGRAIDIRVTGAAALELMMKARAHGFTGIGAKQHGDHGSRFVHLDDLPNGPGCPRPWLWTYR